MSQEEDCLSPRLQQAGKDMKWHSRVTVEHPAPRQMVAQGRYDGNRTSIGPNRSLELSSSIKRVVGLLQKCQVGERRTREKSSHQVAAQMI